ncbi:MAG: undecaprenyl-phosphate glucose phosphotransferase [Flavobacteriaceae bacterium]|nr:undecaprenyl-phosphate glucose phosphotransferase [Flavobacteriaceae bacterium]
MTKKKSFLIRPINIIIDILVINGILYFIGDRDYVNLNFLFYVNLVWLLISYYTDYYRIYRTTGELKVLNLIFGQFFIFILSFFAFFSLFKEGAVIHNQFITISLILVVLFIAKFSFFYALQTYRKLGRNFRRIVIIGSDESTIELGKYLSLNEGFGYRNIGFFSDKTLSLKEYLGKVEDSYQFIIDNNIDEIYCSFSSISKERIKDLIWFAKSNQKKIKLIPEAKEIFRKNLLIEYYDTIPILKVKELPFELGEVRFIKRVFDIVFSLLVCIFLLSWLTPLMWLLIRLESKGPLFFKQKRTGLNGEDFYCYKFRSMKVNDVANKKQATKNDDRITQIGKFIRSTSIDELPQFFNVLKGDMSVVGPRPHMTEQSHGFENKINNYMKRNVVKPGITGLAQVSGYRGEIKKKSDIENRIRLDIFYIEKWSFLLDIKIIFMTIFNVFKGEDKAY